MRISSHDRSLSIFEQPARRSATAASPGVMASLAYALHATPQPIEHLVIRQVTAALPAATPVPASTTPPDYARIAADIMSELGSNDRLSLDTIENVLGGANKPESLQRAVAMASGGKGYLTQADLEVALGGQKRVNTTA